MLTGANWMQAFINLCNLISVENWKKIDQAYSARPT